MAEKKRNITYSAMDPAFVSAHKARMNVFIEHHDTHVDAERYKRKIRIKSMKRPHLSKEVLHQMYGSHRYRAVNKDSTSDSLNPAYIRRHLGPVTGFGDGNGSFWDRWLVKEPPPKSSFANGNAYPLRGYKRLHPDRYQVYEPAPNDPDGQHAVHDLDVLVGMFPDNPLSDRFPKTSESPAQSKGSTDDKTKAAPAADKQEPSAARPTPVCKNLKTDAASAALLRFQKRVEKSTEALAASCVLVDPVLPPIQ